MMKISSFIPFLQAARFLTSDMFSADELLNNGDPKVGYCGYDYMGNKYD